MKSEVWIRKIQMYFEQEGLSIAEPTSARGQRALRAHDRGAFVSTRNFFDAIADDYLTIVFDAEHEVELIMSFVRVIEDCKPTTVLDAGCGVGMTLGFLAQSYPDISFYGSDFSRRSLALADRRLKRNRVRNARTFWCDHYDLERHIDPSSLDLIIASNSTPTWDTNNFFWTMGAFSKLLAPGGICVCHTPSLQANPEMLTQLFNQDDDWLGLSLSEKIQCINALDGRYEESFVIKLRKTTAQTS